MGKEDQVTVGFRTYPVKGLGTKILSIRCTFFVKELDVRYFTTMIFDNDHLTGNWGTGRVSLDKMQALKSCTISLKMELVDVYQHGMCITNRYFGADNNQ